MKTPLKKHASIAAAGGLMVPLSLVLATAIANEAQTLLGLELDNVALSIYLLPFLTGAAIAIQALFKLEMARVAETFAKSFTAGFDAGAEGKPPPDLSQLLSTDRPGAAAEPPPPPPPPPAPPQS